MKKSIRGFTLIELLIVIALLGALAVALLAALDPMEQIKKGNDTGVRNTVAEISSSFTRYASVKAGELPFTQLDWGTITQNGAAYSAIQQVIDAGELKQDFFTLAKDQLGKIYITGINNNGTQKAYVCFHPTSKSFRVDTNTKFGIVSGTPGTMTDFGTGICNSDGVASGGLGDCYWCVQ